MGSLAESASYIFEKKSQTQSCSNLQYKANSIASAGSASKKEIFSVFGESSCGEPRVDQHVILDFTPDKEIDTDYVQEKCCQFWDFIKSVPEIQNLIVLPGKTNEMKPQTQETSEISTSYSEAVSINVDKTAVSMLELTEEKGLINRIFEAKLPKSMCSLGSREYKAADTSTDRRRNGTARSKQKTDQKHRERQSRKEKETSSERTAKTVKLKNMINTMEEWDLKHPKSMEPPGHAPRLEHCVLQRL